MNSSAQDPFAAKQASGFDPYDLSEVHIQATDGPPDSFQNKRLKIPWHIVHASEKVVRLNPNYRSVDYLLRDALYRLVKLLEQNTGSADATELAALLQTEALAQRRNEEGAAASRALKEWEKALRDCETQTERNSAVWELNACVQSLPVESRHRRALEGLLKRVIT